MLDVNEIRVYFDLAVSDFLCVCIMKGDIIPLPPVALLILLNYYSILKIYSEIGVIRDKDSILW